MLEESSSCFPSSGVQRGKFRGGQANAAQLSSNLIGCHWVPSLWTISYKRSVLFCDLQSSENLFGSISSFPEEKIEREITKKM